MSLSDKSFVVDTCALQRLTSVSLLAALLRLSKQVKHYFGPTEEELRRASGLSDDDFDRALSNLLNADECVQHRYLQEGTAGPFAHRYQVPQGLTFRVSWGEEKKV